MPITAAWPYTPEWLLQSKSSPREISGNHIPESQFFFKLLSIHGIVRPHDLFEASIANKRTRCDAQPRKEHIQGMDLKLKVRSASSQGRAGPSALPSRERSSPRVRSWSPAPVRSITSMR